MAQICASDSCRQCGRMLLNVLSVSEGLVGHRYKTILRAQIPPSFIIKVRDGRAGRSSFGLLVYSSRFFYVLRLRFSFLLNMLLIFFPLACFL